MTKKTTPHVVILGAGFGGLYTAKHIVESFKKNEVDVTVVNNTNYFLFTPMLHEVATGGVGHHQVVESLRELFYRTQIKLLVDDVKNVDLKKKVIVTKKTEINFDYLVVALGATTNFYNVPGAKENTLTLKNLKDAIDIRNKIIGNFEKAAMETDLSRRKELLTFAVVGGGPTGVELVAEMAELFWDNIINMYPGVFRASEIRLYLFSQAPELLTQFHRRLRDVSLKVLEDKGIDVHLGSTITEVKKNGVQVEGRSFIPMDTVVWAAGTIPNTPKFKQKVELDHSGRIVVSPHLSIDNLTNVFAIGDVASLADKKTGRPLPMLAQIAVKQAKVVADNISQQIRGEKGDLKHFTYTSAGSLVSLGRWHAVAEIFFFRFSGAIAWVLWRSVYLSKFISKEKRFKIATDWIAGAFSLRDITKA